jgi:hypothetical protein
LNETGLNDLITAFISLLLRGRFVALGSGLQLAALTATLVFQSLPSQLASIAREAMVGWYVAAYSFTTRDKIDDSFDLELVHPN